LAYNAAAAPQAMRKIHQALNAPQNISAAQAVYDLACINGAPTSLKSLGMQEKDLERVLDLALQNQYPNPRPLMREPMRALLQDAFVGRRPV
jgi:maleylacetate reductase